MVRRRFGKTELAMPVFSCGGMRYQDGWKDKPFAEVDPAVHANLEATIARAIEIGVNHIETARGYGVSERQLGQVLPKYPRSEIIVQTKLSPDADTEAFTANILDSLDRLNLEYVDLFSIHGINNAEKLDLSIRPGGCFEALERLRDAGKCRFIGFSTHGSPAVIEQAIAYTSPRGATFDYVNLHWYYIYDETWSCIEMAQRRDMGVFIISPSDKGGMLYKAPPRLQELCAPLNPMTFNDLYCLEREAVHTLSLGAANPSQFEEHLDALPLLPNARQHLDPILARLKARYAECIEPELRDPWALKLPRWQDIPGHINVGRIVQLRNLAKAYDMVEYGQFRYNMLGTAADWVPGEKAFPELIAEHRPALEALFAPLPAGKHLMGVLEEAHALFYKEDRKRLSES